MKAVSTFVAVAVLAALAAPGCEKQKVSAASEPSEGMSAQQLAKAKRTELYSWQELTSDAWYFSLIEPSRKARKVDEIVAPKRTLASANDLLEHIRKLPKNSVLVWLDSPRDTGGATVVFKLPPEETIDRVGDACRERSIRLFVARPGMPPQE